MKNLSDIFPGLPKVFPPTMLLFWYHSYLIFVMFSTYTTFGSISLRYATILLNPQHMDKNFKQQFHIISMLCIFTGARRWIYLAQWPHIYIQRYSADKVLNFKYNFLNFNIELA